MGRHLARTLWLVSVGLLAASGCNHKSTARERNIAATSASQSHASKAQGQAQADSESVRLAAATPGGGENSVVDGVPADEPAADEGRMGKRDSSREAGEFDFDSAAAPDEPGPAAAPPPAPPRSMRAERSRRALGSTGHGVGGGGMGVGIVSGRAQIKSHSVAPKPIVLADPGDSKSEDYKNYGVNPMVTAAEDRLSTFAVDVDTASYVIARRKLNEGANLPTSAVRVEEFVNYFRYAYPGPQNDQPFAVHMDAAPSPFTQGRHVVRIGVQAKRLSKSERKTAHLTFLVDVSGSMGSADKLPLAKRALRILVNNLNDGDTVALVTYAGNTRVVLPPTGVDRRGRIMTAIENLDASGSTAMSSGIQLAYEQAAKNLSPNSVSRVIVLSDGDANVGATDHGRILKQIQGKVKEGVTLSTIGFGMGNYKDQMMEQLANKGNGNYYYIDGISQAKRVFQEQLGGTLEVVAKDVKIQVEFNPNAVKRYRLVGYENRDVADRDFRNDRVDAGEIGAGHTVTAMYEVELTGSGSENLGTVRLRAKKPRGSHATETAYPLKRSAMAASFDRASDDFRFATAVMAGAEILRGSEHARSWSLEQVIKIAKAAAGSDRDRLEFADLMGKANRRPVATR